MRVQGEQRFHANCGRCHATPQKFSPRVMATVIRHMRVRATITDARYASDPVLYESIVLHEWIVHDQCCHNSVTTKVTCLQPMTKSRCIRRNVLRMAIVLALLVGLSLASTPARVIELTADSDSRYKIAGMRTPEITVKAGEEIRLKVTARRGSRGIGMVRFMASRCFAPRTEQGRGVGSDVQARNAGVRPHRALRAGRIRCGLHRNLQRRPRRHAHEVHRAALSYFEHGGGMEEINLVGAASSNWRDLRRRRPHVTSTEKSPTASVH